MDQLGPRSNIYPSLPPKTPDEIQETRMLNVERGVGEILELLHKIDDDLNAIRQIPMVKLFLGKAGR